MYTIKINNRYYAKGKLSDSPFVYDREGLLEALDEIENPEVEIHPLYTAKYKIKACVKKAYELQAQGHSVRGICRILKISKKQLMSAGFRIRNMECL